MHNIIYTPQSLDNLNLIKEFIAKDNSKIAIHVIETIFHFVNNLSLFSLIGRESNS